MSRPPDEGRPQTRAEVRQSRGVGAQQALAALLESGELAQDENGDIYSPQPPTLGQQRKYRRLLRDYHQPPAGRLLRPGEDMRDQGHWKEDEP